MTSRPAVSSCARAKALCAVALAAEEEEAERHGETLMKRTRAVHGNARGLLR